MTQITKWDGETWVENKTNILKLETDLRKSLDIYMKDNNIKDLANRTNLIRVKYGVSPKNEGILKKITYGESK